MKQFRITPLGENNGEDLIRPDSYRPTSDSHRLEVGLTQVDAERVWGVIQQYGSAADTHRITGAEIERCFELAYPTFSTLAGSVRHCLMDGWDRDGSGNVDSNEFCAEFGLHLHRCIASSAAGAPLSCDDNDRVFPYEYPNGTVEMVRCA